jgi:hypothetical protein
MKVQLFKTFDFDGGIITFGGTVELPFPPTEGLTIRDGCGDEYVVLDVVYDVNEEVYECDCGHEEDEYDSLLDLVESNVGWTIIDVDTE